MEVEDKPLTTPPAEKTKDAWQPENDFQTGFLTIFSLQGPPSTLTRKPPVFRTNPPPPPRAQSQIMCVGTFDLVSVSMTVRSVSNNLRPDT